VKTRFVAVTVVAAKVVTLVAVPNVASTVTAPVFGLMVID